MDLKRVDLYGNSLKYRNGPDEGQRSKIKGK